MVCSSSEPFSLNVVNFLPVHMDSAAGVDAFQGLNQTMESLKDIRLRCFLEISLTSHSLGENDHSLLPRRPLLPSCLQH